MLASASLITPVSNGPSHHTHRSLHSIPFPPVSTVGSSHSPSDTSSSSPTSTATTASLGSPLLDPIQAISSPTPAQTLDPSSLPTTPTSPPLQFSFGSSAPASPRIDLNGAYLRLPPRRRSDSSQDDEKSNGDVELADIEDSLTVNETDRKATNTTENQPVSMAIPPAEAVLELDESAIAPTDLGTTPTTGSGDPLVVPSSIEVEGSDTNPTALFEQQEDLSRYLQPTGPTPVTSETEEVPSLSPASDTTDTTAGVLSTSKDSSTSSSLEEDSSDQEEVSPKPKVLRHRQKRRASCPVPQPSSIKRPATQEKPHIMLSASTGSTGEATLAAAASLKDSPSPPPSSSSTTTSSSGICAVDGCTMTSRKGRKLCHKHQKLRERGVELPALREGVSLGRSRKPYECLGKTQKYERQLQAKEILSRILADPVAEQHVLMELWPNHTTESVIAKNARNFFHTLPASSPFRLQLLAALSEGLSDRSACSEFGVSLQALVRARHQRGDGVNFGIPEESERVSAPLRTSGGAKLSRSPSPSKPSASSKPTMGAPPPAMSHLPLPPPPQSMEPLGLYPSRPIPTSSSYHPGPRPQAYPHTRGHPPSGLIPPPPSSPGSYPVLNLGGFSSSSNAPLSITPITMHIPSSNPLPPLPPLPLSSTPSPSITAPPASLASSASSFSSTGFNSFPPSASKEAPSPPNVFINTTPSSPMLPSFNNNPPNLGGNGNTNVLNVDFFSSYLPSSDPGAGGGRRNSLDFLSGGGLGNISASFLVPNNSSASTAGGNGGGSSASPLSLSPLFPTPTSSQPNSASSSTSSLNETTPTTERSGVPASTPTSNSLRIPPGASSATGSNASNLDLESESWFGTTVDLSQLATPLPPTPGASGSSGVGAGPGSSSGGAPPAEGVVVDESFVVPGRTR